MNELLKKIFILPIRFYQMAISPMLGSSCKFRPTCSQYMVLAIQEWGIFKGTWLGMKRIWKCHPWNKDDMHDPVPKKDKKTVKF